MLRGIFFGRTEEQLAQNLTKFFQAGSWVLNQLKPAGSDCRFFSFVREEGVNASWRNARYTNMN